MREAMAVKEVRDAMQLVENAILEKDEALARDAQKKEEVNSVHFHLFPSDSTFLVLCGNNKPGTA